MVPPSPASGSVLVKAPPSPASGSVLVMAKAPMAGHVKTRLAPLLGENGCAALQELLIAHAAVLAESIAPGSSFVAVEPWEKRDLVEPLVGSTAHLVPQVGGNLGERMATATETVLALRPGPLAVIGTDAPTLTPALVCEAFEKLRDGCDCVFGPALDGGYYLVGLDRPLSALFSIDPALWGGRRVLEASLDAARACGLNVGILLPLSDLDTEDDAELLAEDPALPPDVARILTRGLARQEVTVP